MQSCVLAAGGDRVDLEVSMDDLGRLESIDDDNDVGEEEKPLTGPLPGLGKAYKPPPSSAWFTVACMGFGLLVLSIWPFVVHLSCKGTQNLRGEGSGNIQHAESEVCRSFTDQSRRLIKCFFLLLSHHQSRWIFGNRIVLFVFAHKVSLQPNNSAFIGILFLVV